MKLSPLPPIAYALRTQTATRQASNSIRQLPGLQGRWLKKYLPLARRTVQLHGRTQLKKNQVT